MTVKLTSIKAGDLTTLAFRSYPLPMWFFDQQTLAFLDVNQAAIRDYGYSRQEFLSMTVLDIRPPEDIPTFLHSAVHPHFKGPSQRELWRHRKKDGTVIEVEITSQEVKYQGRPAELVLIRRVQAAEV